MGGELLGKYGLTFVAGLDLSGVSEKRRRVMAKVCDFTTEAGIFNCDSSPDIPPRRS